MTTPTSSELIDALGGSATVAKAMNKLTGENLTRNAASMWRRGFPVHRIVLLAFAFKRVAKTSNDYKPENWHRLFPELQKRKPTSH